MLIGFIADGFEVVFVVVVVVVVCLFIGVVVLGFADVIVFAGASAGVFDIVGVFVVVVFAGAIFDCIVGACVCVLACGLSVAGGIWEAVVMF